MNKSTQVQFVGEKFARGYLAILSSDALFHCAACGQRAEESLGYQLFMKHYAVVYGQPVGLCDLECYDMLKANWQDTRGRIQL